MTSRLPGSVRGFRTWVAAGCRGESNRLPSVAKLALNHTDATMSTIPAATSTLTLGTLHDGLAVRRWLPVAPMPRRDAETAHPMHVETIPRAIEDEVLKLTFEVGLHLHELEPKHLGVGDRWIGPTVPDPDRLVDEVVGLGGLLGHGVDGAFEDFAFLRH